MLTGAMAHEFSPAHDGDVAVNLGHLIVVDDDGLEVLKLFMHLKDLVQLLLVLSDNKLGLGVVHHVFNGLGAVGRVCRHSDSKIKIKMDR